MKIVKIVLTLFFALLLGVICLIGAASLAEQDSDQPGFQGTSEMVWYALGGFILGLAGGIAVLRRLSPRYLGFVSIGLGSLVFIAAAIILYLINKD